MGKTIGTGQIEFDGQIRERQGWERSFKQCSLGSPPASVVAAGLDSSSSHTILSRSNMLVPAAQVILMGLIEGYRVNGGPAGESLDKLCAPATCTCGRSRNLLTKHCEQVATKGTANHFTAWPRITSRMRLTDVQALQSRSFAGRSCFTGASAAGFSWQVVMMTGGKRVLKALCGLADTVNMCLATCLLPFAKGGVLAMCEQQVISVGCMHFMPMCWPGAQLITSTVCLRLKQPRAPHVAEKLAAALEPPLQVPRRRLL